MEIDRRQIVAQLLACARGRDRRWFWDVRWDEAVFLRECLIRIERGEQQAWTGFLDYLAKRPRLACKLRYTLEESGLLYWNLSEDRAYPALKPYVEQLDDLLQVIDSADMCNRETVPRAATKTKEGRSEIMYLEAKPELNGPARIGRVHFSQTGKTIYYGQRAFQSLKGGYKRNYYDVETRESFWISRPRQDGRDRLCPGIVKIDEEVREEYWLKIRQRPAHVALKAFRSNGKHRR